MSRAVMQQVLAALEGGDVMCEVIAAGMLRTELAKPEREPVAQWQKRHPLRTAGAWKNTDEHDAKWWVENSRGWEMRALYISPPQSRPLLPVDVRAMMDENGYSDASPQEQADFINGIRHSEIHHEITGDKSSAAARATRTA
jgi:hypothetical protein